MSVVAEQAPSEPITRVLNEHERLLANRTIGLLDLGFSMEQVLLLVRITDVVHKAADLRAKGAPHDFIVEELT